MVWYGAVLRWMHVFAGIIWIGLLYYFNLVNGQMSAKLDGAAKKDVVPELMPRALFWFRWGAAWTWITGVLMLFVIYYDYVRMNLSPDGWSAGVIAMIAITFLAVFVYDGLWSSRLESNVGAAVIVSFVLLSVVVALFHYVGHFTYRGMMIHTGALLGTTMAFNVWFRIWPAQQKIIRAVKDGETPASDVAALASLRSKHNTYMSLPLLWAMLTQHSKYFAGGNLGVPNQYAWALWIPVIIIGWYIIFQCYEKASKVQGL